MVRQMTADKTGALGTPSFLKANRRDFLCLVSSPACRRVDTLNCYFTALDSTSHCRARQVANVYGSDVLTYCMNLQGDKTFGWMPALAVATELAMI
jgi:hypothetical protein